VGAKAARATSGPGARTLRQTAPGWTLLRAAVGGPRELAGKAARMGRTVRLWFDRPEIERRLRALEEAGLIRERPSRLQMIFGSYDMFRWVITPAARDYYQQRGIRFGFHQLLRVLDDPMSMVDPSGILSDRDTIVGHVMQVVHLNPVYDLQLIQMFDDGLEDFERQVEAMVAGTHPRARSIGAIVEEPGYHERLLDYVRRFRADPRTAQLVRQEQTLRRDPAFAAAERTFATLPGFMDYCTQLPRGPLELLRRARRVRTFPVASASPP
jgi:hypothetical protein